MGSIWQHRDRWYVGFYYEGKQRISGYYKGEKMYSPNNVLGLTNVNLTANL